MLLLALEERGREGRVPSGESAEKRPFPGRKGRSNWQMARVDGKVVSRKFGGGRRKVGLRRRTCETTDGVSRGGEPFGAAVTNAAARAPPPNGVSAIGTPLRGRAVVLYVRMEGGRSSPAGGRCLWHG